MFNIMCFYRENEDRLEKLGKSLSVQSKQYRAKRIDVNVKINGVGYLAEVLGGVLVTLLAFHHKVSILNTFALFWYGNVIPSCYLINFVQNKKSIMTDGWRATISQLYQKKTVKSNVTSSKQQIPTASRQHEGRMIDQSNTLKDTQKKIEPKTNLRIEERNSSSCECCNCKVEKKEERPLSNKLHKNKGEIILFDLESDSPENRDIPVKKILAFNNSSN